MPHTFSISVFYEGREKTFEAELRLFVYTHKIAMYIENIEILFEPDEQGNYRAVIPGNQPDQYKPDARLLEAIAGELERAFH